MLHFAVTIADMNKMLANLRREAWLPKDSHMMRSRYLKNPVLLLGGLCVSLAVGVGGCDGAAKDELTKRVNEASDKIFELRKENNDLKNQVSGLKKQLAAAMLNPGKVQLTDPETIELVADMRKQAGGNDELLGKGSLDPGVASKVVMNGTSALHVCYERALKKNTALQYQAGLGLTLDITVKPQGMVDTVDVAPSVDQDMTACIKTAAMRWKFPTFVGGPVTIQQKIKLTPKT